MCLFKLILNKDNEILFVSLKFQTFVSKLDYNVKIKRTSNRSESKNCQNPWPWSLS